MRGRTIEYLGDRRTRPMKDRVREAVFNLLGPAVRDTLVLDLFAGTGALALEAISRGAARALAIDRHFPTVRGIQKNAESLQVGNLQAIGGDAFHWLQHFEPPGPERWLAFCCPPYDFYLSRSQEMRGMLDTLLERSPPGSMIVVESDLRFPAGRLPAADQWEVRPYPPAQIAIYHQPFQETPSASPARTPAPGE